MASTHKHFNSSDEEPQTSSSSINKDEPIPEVSHQSEIESLVLKHKKLKSNINVTKKLKRMLLEKKRMIKEKKRKIKEYEGNIIEIDGMIIENQGKIIEKKGKIIEIDNKMINMLASEVSSLHNKMDKIIDMLSR